MFRIIGFAMTLMATSAAAQTVSIETYTGQEEVIQSPENIAVFDLAAFDTLTALGVKAQGLIRPVFLPYLEDAAESTVSVGSLFEPDFEAVFALQPDLIIAGGRSSGQVSELARIAPTIDMTIWEDPVRQGLDRLAAYGEIFNRRAEAKLIATEYKQKMKQAKTAVSGKGRALIVLANGPKISAYGAGGRFGWLHTALDLSEAVPNVEQATHGEAISFEFIREANPDILLVIDRQAAIGQEGASAQATLDNVLIHETTAWKANRVVYLSSAPVYIAGGGIQSMTLTLDEIMVALKDG